MITSNHYTQLLHNLVKFNKVFKKRLYVSEDYSDYVEGGHSGIVATVFGGSGFIGKYIGARLGMIGSDILFPISRYGDKFADDIRSLKLSAPISRSYIMQDGDFSDQNLLEKYMKNSNVVINCLGPRVECKRRSDFQQINIEIPQKIAKAVSNSPNVKRFIHFSSIGIDENSQSLDLQTKAIGQKLVREAFPETTIMRPGLVVGYHDHFTEIIFRTHIHTLGTNFVFSNCKSKKQPISAPDVSLCVLNALKMDQTVGKTYQLGGNHIYELLELYEIICNYLERKPRIWYVNRQLSLKLTRSLLFLNHNFFNMQAIIKCMNKQPESFDRVVSPNALGVQDLCVMPVNFKKSVQVVLEAYRTILGMSKDDNQY